MPELELKSIWENESIKNQVMRIENSLSILGLEIKLLKNKLRKEKVECFFYEGRENLTKNGREHGKGKNKPR
jgi:hypothetical protein